MWKITLTFLVLLVINCFAADVNPVVCFESGCVKGDSIDNYDVFFGIPYAKPPINDLRLRDPEPIPKWSGVKNAMEQQAYCIQKNYLIVSQQTTGSEDCLHLYVYRPKVINKKKLLPVIVYIHGGGFFAGSGGPSFTGGDYFMKSEEVIFVAMNYRLGPLGFLSTGDGSMSGNFGLKDQAMAIQWVKKNIGAFGGEFQVTPKVIINTMCIFINSIGNASSITLMGQSIGATSVHLHMMSPMTQNLFHRVVLISGNGLAPYTYIIKDPLTQARKYAEVTGIKNFMNLTTSELANKLRKLGPKALIDATDVFKFWSVDQLTVSRPVIEDCFVTEGFLCKDPIEMWQKGEYVQMPILTGFTDGDGGVRALAIVQNQTLVDDLNKRFNYLAPKLLEIEQRDPELLQTQLNQIKSRYLKKTGLISEKNYDELVQIYTDRSFIAPLYNSIRMKLAHDQKHPVYLYKFSYQGAMSYSMFYTGTLNPYGVTHCDELIYILKSSAMFLNDFPAGSKDMEMRTVLLKYFVDFAVNGKPSKLNDKPAKKCEMSSENVLDCNYVEFTNDFTFPTDVFNGEVFTDKVLEVPLMPKSMATFSYITHH
ncbi:unnamed protein product [Diamesa serratosioi]